MPMTATNARTPLVTPAMLVTFALLASAPFWVNRVGLYPYLALEIMIWMIFALGFNLLLGYGGLPSFGHGAFFGVGAYAFGLLQLKLGAGLLAGLAGAVLAAALAGAVVAAFVSHRRGIYFALLTIAFGQVLWFIAIKWHSVTGGEDGLLNIKRPPLDLGFASVSLASNIALYFFTLRDVRAGGAVPVAAHPFAVRPRAAGGEAERDPRGLPRPPHLALQVHRLRAFDRHRGAGRRRCSRWRSSRRTRT